jgi:quinolinate synthase
MMDESQKKLVEQIRHLREQKDAVIVAHYYTPGEVQDLADFTGDSYYLSKVAKNSNHKLIVFCGVEFMAESAKVLSPEKTVLLPDLTADCPMAEMATPEDVADIRAQYGDLAVVCYINSTLAVKAVSDVVVTSSNATEVVSKLPQKNIYFLPDKNLGRYVASKLPEKNFIFHDGYCHVHTSIEIERLNEAKAKYPEALVLTHPECNPEVVAASDYVGSTSGIIKYARDAAANEFIICTEMGVFFDLARKAPGKKFYSVGHRQLCPSMKKISLEKVYESLANETHAVEVDQEMAAGAAKALSKMHELAG